MVKQNEYLKFDPYTGLELINAELWVYYIGLVFGMLAVSLFGHYLNQRELSLNIIEKTLIKRQQTQLKNFLLDNDDALIVFNKQRKNEVVLQNDAAKTLFAGALSILDFVFELQESPDTTKLESTKPTTLGELISMDKAEVKGKYAQIPVSTTGEQGAEQKSMFVKIKTY